MRIISNCNKIRNKISIQSKKFAIYSFGCLQRITHRTLDTSTMQDILTVSNNITKDLISFTKKSNKITQDELFALLEKNLGKKKAKNVEIYTDENKIANVFQKEFNYSHSESIEAAQDCTAMALYSPKTGKSYLYIPSKILDNLNAENVSIVAHECHHISFINKSLYFKILNFLETLFPKNKANEKHYIETVGHIFNGVEARNAKKINYHLKTLSLSELFQVLSTFKDETRAHSIDEKVKIF